MSESQLFKFRRFELNQNASVFKIGTDAFVLGSWIGNLDNCKQILDVGTGTGVLAMMAAQHYPDAEITAIDNNSASTKLANLNFSKSDLGKNCRAYYFDFLNIEEDQTFDLILSNPPYFLDSSAPIDVVLEQAKHLTSNDLELFFEKASKLLSPSGKMCLIYPIDERFEQMAFQVGLFAQRILNIYGKPGLLKRQCVQFGFLPMEPIQEELTIRDEHGKYTTAYKDFTREFHGVDL